MRPCRASARPRPELLLAYLNDYQASANFRDREPRTRARLRKADQENRNRVRRLPARRSRPTGARAASFWRGVTASAFTPSARRITPLLSWRECFRGRTIAASFWLIRAKKAAGSTARRGRIRSGPAPTKAAFLAKAPKHLHLALRLAIWTGPTARRSAAPAVERLRRKIHSPDAIEDGRRASSSPSGRPAQESPGRGEASLTGHPDDRGGQALDRRVDFPRRGERRARELASSA